jgi:hypothetical protein
MSEQYRKNVQAMCDRLGLPNPIREEDLMVTRLSFFSRLSVIHIDGTDMNRAGRLFFQEHFSEKKYPGTIQLTEPLRLAAADFFAENWRDAEEKGRQMLIAIKSARRFKIHWK